MFLPLLLTSCGRGGESSTTSDDLSNTSVTSGSNIDNTTSQIEEVENQIFISEFFSIRELSSEACVEISNTSGKTIDLNNYVFNVFWNGQNTVSLNLSGELENNDSIIIKNNSFDELEDYDYVLDGDYLYRNRYLEIYNISDKQVIDVYGMKDYNYNYFSRGNPIRRETKLFSCNVFDVNNYYCITYDNYNYLRNLNTPIIESDFEKGPTLSSVYQEYPFAQDGVALGGFFETYYTSLGDGDTTFFYYPEESGADELGSRSTRYLFINTPEIDHGPSSSIVEEPWGQAAKKYNNDILKNAKHIIIQSARHSALHETYGRYLGCVWYTNEENPTLDDYILLNYQIAYNGYSEQANSGSYNEMISNDMYYSYYFEVAFNRARDLGLKVFGEIDPDFDY